MINIVHQKVTSKPPINKKIFKKTPGHNVGSRETRGGKSAKDEEEEKINECTECSDQESRGQDGFVKKNGPSDCNQNIIESDSCSLDQLCSMISDLEQSLDHQVVAVDTCIYPTENPVTFIDLDHVSFHFLSVEKVCFIIKSYFRCWKKKILDLAELLLQLTMTSCLFWVLWSKIVHL